MKRKRPVSKWRSRSTIFAAFFAITGFILACKGMLTMAYVSMCSAVQVLVTGRAVAEDYHERNLKKPVSKPPVPPVTPVAHGEESDNDPDYFAHFT